ncbi:hypothetical protein FT641_18105 [Bacillus paranthracis]|uniref:MerR family transcriptional regulator n=1 Tax=Bacillus paranthracis TaxID=2026186 RepID=UPI001879173D|nr:MerR family transcriptional regulator [Bacillus paranthracis]MBE7114524.1 hypothetical protein [Bacillus paranthracis]MBE7154602.1 hypothetical protein [Bacillus paranthracis]
MTAYSWGKVPNALKTSKQELRDCMNGLESAGYVFNDMGATDEDIAVIKKAYDYRSRGFEFREVGNMIMKPEEISDTYRKLLSETTYSLDELVELLGWLKIHIIQISSNLHRSGYVFPLNGAGKRIYTDDAVLKIRKVNEFSEFGMSISAAAQKVMEMPADKFKLDSNDTEDVVSVPANVFSQIIQNQIKIENVLINLLDELKDVKDELKELKRE